MRMYLFILQINFAYNSAAASASIKLGFSNLTCLNIKVMFKYKKIRYLGTNRNDFDRCDYIRPI